VLSESRGWLFVHVPKTGGNSLQSALVSFSDDRLVAGGVRDGVERFEVQGPVTRHKHFSLQDYADALAPDTIAKLFKFSVVRDPWERAISWYFSPHRWALQGKQPIWSPDDFRGCLCEMVRACDMLSIGGKYEAIDMLLRFESLIQDVQVLFDRLRLGRIILPHRNRGMRGLNWYNYYAMHPELVGLVADMFGADAEAFGYRRPA
jgi:Sulfotransferase family